MSWPDAFATVGVSAVWITMTVCDYLENKESGDE